MKALQNIRVILYSVSMYIVFFNIVLGTMFEILLIFDIDDNIIRIMIATHAFTMWPVYAIWFKYISPNYYDTPKAPIYLVFMAWYNTIFVFIFTNSIWNIDHYGKYDTSSVMFTLLCAASFFFIWYWDRIKEEIDYSFR